MNKKLRVGILCGGKSAEHEVSLQSAQNVFDAIDRAKYEPVLIGIAKDGRWCIKDSGSFLLNADDPKLIGLSTANKAIAPLAQGEAARALDVVFPILHGPFGEDGTMQGLLKLAELPFVGAGVLGSAVGMDKDVMKRLLRDDGLPIGKFRALHSSEPLPRYEELCAELGTPLFVKPANMGSSVGVYKVRAAQEFAESAAAAFEYDTKIIVEEFIAGRELECAVLGSPFAPDRAIKPSRDFYSYDAKYLDEDGAALCIPADIAPETAERIRALAVKAFNTLCCDALARVDFFLKTDGAILINEINTMPGFTQISMYPKLWEATGVPYTKLIDNLIELAIARFEKERRLKTSVNGK